MNDLPPPPEEFDEETAEPVGPRFEVRKALLLALAVNFFGPVAFLSLCWDLGALMMLSMSPPLGVVLSITSLARATSFLLPGVVFMAMAASITFGLSLAVGNRTAIRRFVVIFPNVTLFFFVSGSSLIGFVKEQLSIYRRWLYTPDSSQVQAFLAYLFLLGLLNFIAYAIHRMPLDEAGASKGDRA